MDNLKMFSKIADILTSESDFEVQMNSIFKTMSKQTKFCQAYIFVVDDDKSAVKKLQWFSSVNDSKLNSIDKISFENMEIIKRIFLEKGKLYTDNIKELPTQVVDSLIFKGASSVAVFPFFVSNVIAGFVGFNKCNNQISWSDSDIYIFRTIASILSNVFEKEYFIKRIIEDKENFKHFFNSIEDLIFIGNDKCDIIFTNDSVTKKLGYSKEELLKMKIIDVHAFEKRDQAEKVLGDVINGKTEDCLLEIRKKDGTIIPVETRAWLGKWNNQECIFGVCRNLSKEQEALQKFIKLFENNPLLMAVISLPDRKFVNANIAFIEKVGYSYNEIIGKTSEELNLYADLFNKENILEELGKNKKFNDMEIHIKGKNGEILTGLFSGEIIHDQKGEYLLAVLVDITEMKRVQNLYESEKTKLESIIEVTGLGIWEWNIKTGKTIFNERWAEMIGYTLDEISPTTIDTWGVFIHPEDINNSSKALEKHFQGKSDCYDCECRMKHKDGNWIWIQDRGKVVEWSMDGEPIKMYGTHRDITQIKETEKTIIEISNRDPLTNIYNRRYIFDRLEKDIERYQRKEITFALAILDIDHFKIINDNFGHLAGDYILKEFTMCISENLRDYDMAGRFGGEEFIIIMYDSDKIEAEIMIRRLMEIVSEKLFTFENNIIKFTFSAGISDIEEFSNKIIRTEEIISLADKRLYKAKDNGRNRIEIV